MEPPPLPYRAVAGPDDLYPQFRPQDGAAAATAIAALSQHSAPAPAGVAPGAAAGAVPVSLVATTPTSTRKRRSTGVPSNRGVANLTPEQLAKKRANDREAQRAIRERTRKTIDGLQRRIEELESQQPFQELQRVVQERDRALAECDELRKKLLQVAGIAGGASATVSPVQSQPNLHELANVTAQQSPLPPLITNPSLPQQQQQQTPPAGAAPAYEQSNLHPDLRSPVSQTTNSSITTSSRVHPANGSISPVTKRARKWSATNSDRGGPTAQAAANGVSYEQQPHQAAVLHGGGGELSGAANYPLDRDPDGTIMPDQRPQPPRTANSQPLWSRLPLNGEPTCPLDSILQTWIEGGRKQIASGVPVEKVIGPRHPNFGPLRTPPDHRDVHPLSALLIDMLYKFPDFKTLPEQVAVVHIVSRIVRWHICPCESCYYDLPLWMRPIQEQYDIRHARWMDYIPWPSIRQRLAVPTTSVKFEDFFVPYTKTMSLNWPLSEDQILLTPKPGETNPVEINPAFESHLRELSNWSLGDEFANVCPSLMSNDVRMSGPLMH